MEDLMQNSIKPDKKYFTKVLWMLITITVLLILAVAVTHFIIYLNHGEMEVALILWLGGIISLFLMWLISTPIAYLWIKNLEYTILEDGIRIHKGIITKIKQNIPFRAVTDFALQRTLFDRILGIGSIKIQTAGQSHSATGYEGKLAGLIDYEDWHSDLRERVKSLHPLSESTTTAETDFRSDTDLLKEILVELKEIKKNTARE
jgi:uncharacterized membrane protein YdbT with pleckstrin-like domain